MPLPPRQPGGGNLFTDFAGGGYFYLDHRDRAVIPTTTRHVYVVRETGGGSGFAIERDYDLSTVGAAGRQDHLRAARLGRAGCGSRRPAASSGRSTRRPAPCARGRWASRSRNSFAVEDTGAVFVVTDAAMYRLDAGADGSRARCLARRPTRTRGVQKPGQASAGSGTTPTLMGDGLVAITDNADPMNVLVYRRGGRRSACAAQPVFAQGRERHRPVADRHRPLAGGREQLRLLGPGRHAGRPHDVAGPRARRPRRRGGGCHTVWRSAERAPSVVPKLSAAQRDRLHVHEGPAAVERERRRLVPDGARLRRTGRTLYKRLGGEGLGFNNNYAPVTLGPDGTAYVGAPRRARRAGATRRRRRAPSRRPGPPAAAVGCGGCGCTCADSAATACACG